MISRRRWLNMSPVTTASVFPFLLSFLKMFRAQRVIKYYFLVHFPAIHGFAAFQHFCFISSLFSQFSDVSRRAYCVFKGASQWHVQNRRLLPVQDFCRSMYTIDQQLIRDCYSWLKCLTVVLKVVCRFSQI